MEVWTLYLNIVFTVAEDIDPPNGKVENIYV
jgi:hypothetical protein